MKEKLIKLKEIRRKLKNDVQISYYMSQVIVWTIVLIIIIIL